MKFVLSIKSQRKPLIIDLTVYGRYNTNFVVVLYVRKKWRSDVSDRDEISQNFIHGRLGCDLNRRGFTQDILYDCNYFVSILTLCL
jgi:hypothetical protein